MSIELYDKSFFVQIKIFFYKFIRKYKIFNNNDLLVLLEN